MGLQNTSKAEICRKIKDELDLPYTTVSAVIDEIFYYTSDFIKQPYEYENKSGVFLRHFGTFKPRPYILNLKAEKTQDNIEEWKKFNELVQKKKK